ncbi:MAG TPA: hypothetical protein PKA00_11675 [Saprospiraceae bacterium]|nr:hypothetical protein [Saprospiraceae bacterium]HMQ70768.1 hypothetical protein [Ignavibacteria bacterium]HMQ83563.1 hypothetical protein [Saprospiraceae bacterium]
MKSQFYYWEKDLRKLINSWDLIHGAPSDEFDALNHKILSHLTKGVDKEKLFRVLKSELIIYYGLDPIDNDIHQLTEEIINWWNNQ